MEEIELKLESNNPILISHAISKILDTIKKQNEEQTEKSIMKSAELNLLTSKCGSTEIILSTTACHGMIKLVANGLLSIQSALSTLTLCFSYTENHSAIAAAITQILILEMKSQLVENKYKCPFTLDKPQHPFITILNQNQHSWRFVMNETKFIFNHSETEIVDNSMKMLQPLFLYIFCQPNAQTSGDCKQQLWHTLITMNRIEELQYKVLSWQCTNNINICMDANDRILELAQMYLSREKKDYCTALLPIISSCALKLIDYGHNPYSNFQMIIDIMKKYNDIDDITVILLAEMILTSPSLYLSSIVEICGLIIETKSCNKTVLHVIIASLLKWLAYPSILCSETLEKAIELIKKIYEKSWTTKIQILNTNPIFEKLKQNDTNIQFNLEILQSIDTHSRENLLTWLNNLSKTPIDLRYKCRLIISGLFIQSQDKLIVEKVGDILVKISLEINSFASHVLTLVLHKITKSRDPVETKNLLLALPELIISKENIPIIVHTLELFSNSGEPLKYLAIELYLRILNKEPRCYRFLFTALSRLFKEDRCWKSNIICAKAILNISNTRPANGEELIPFLSDILNRCTNDDGGLATALAIQSITILCKSTIIGIISTWKILAPKLNKEKRTIVVKSICEFFQEIPSCPAPQGGDLDTMMFEITSKLWSYVVSDDLDIIKSAFKALSSYGLEQMPVEALPNEFTDSIIDVENLKNKSLLSQFIPGACWIKMLQILPKPGLTSAGDLLIVYITSEINNFHSNIYNWPHGEPMNFKYLSDKSIIRTIGQYLKNYNVERNEEEHIMLECLRIFSHKYPKPLPNVNWIFLKNLMNISEIVENYIFTIACRHADVSPSAKIYLDDYLNQFQPDCNVEELINKQQFLIVCQHFSLLCQVSRLNSLKMFFESSMDYLTKQISFEDETSLNFFQILTNSCAEVLQEGLIDDIVVAVFFNVFDKLFDQIDLSCNKYQCYIDAVLELPMKDVEKITSPNGWWETTDRKLKNALFIRTKFVLEKGVNGPLVWLDDIIDKAVVEPGLRRVLLEQIQIIQSSNCFDESNAQSMFNFMGTVVTLDNEAKMNFYCDVLFVSIICLSGMDYLLLDRGSLLTSEEIRARLFPQAIAVLAERSYWKEMIPQIMDWFHHMRTSIVSNLYKDVFHNSLISLRHEKHYKNTWMKYLSVIKEN